MRNIRLRIGDCRLRIQYPKGRMIIDQRGYSLTFWAVFFGFVMIPIMALGIELGRYFYARAEVAKAADAAALAAAAEINQQVFEVSGNFQHTGSVWVEAQVLASLNANYLANYGINAVVTGISVDKGKDTVLVQISADLNRYFPSVLPNIVVTETGYAQIRGFTQ